MRDEFNSGVKLSSMVSADRFTTPFEALIVIVDRLMLEVIGPSCSTICCWSCGWAPPMPNADLLHLHPLLAPSTFGSARFQVATHSRVPAQLCIYSYVCEIFPLNIVPIPSYLREVWCKVRQIFDGDLYVGTIELSPTRSCAP